MEDFPSNSHKARNPSEREEGRESKKVRKVVVGDVDRRKKTFGRRLAETFIGGDIRSVLEYTITEVLIPAAKDAVTDALTEGIRRTIHGDNHPSSRRHSSRSSSRVGHTDYQNRYSKERRVSRGETRRVRRRYEVEPIVVESRTEADEVLKQMDELISEYGFVSVSELYEMVGEPISSLDYDWGWSDIRGARSRLLRNRTFEIILPDPEPLNEN